MRLPDWWAEVRTHADDLRQLVNTYHPSKLPGQQALPITAAKAEAFCVAARAEIAAKTLFISFDHVLHAQDHDALLNLLNEAWFGVPESTDCWQIPGFKALCDLCSDPPEELMNDRSMLAKLVKSAKKFRNKPIDGDDFLAVTDDFDCALQDAEEHLKTTRPKVVCLCGSTRFWEIFQEQGLRLTLEGVIVLSIGVTAPVAMHYAHVSDAAGLETKRKLDELHRCKIDLADEILVISDESGYVGSSTGGEILYAQSQGKPVCWLHPAAESYFHNLCADKA